MRVCRIAAVLILVVGCGPSSSGGNIDAGSTGADAMVAPSIDAGPVCTSGQMGCNQLDVLTCVDGAWETTESCTQDVELCEAGACVPCPELSFDLETKQACAMTILPGFEMDAESYITLEGQDHQVLAMDRWGNGHITAWCDGTTLGDLLLSFDLAQYLGQVPTPRVASFGDQAICSYQGWVGSPVPSWVQYQGENLPMQYRSNPALLAADWDVVIFCGFRISWSYDWSNEIREFVATHGKGFLAIMDYEGVVQGTDFTNMTTITSQAGIQFEPLNLAWAPSSTNVVLDCVPDVPIVE